MATIVCPGLQSCLESPLEPRALRLKLSSSILPHFSRPFEPFFQEAKTAETAKKCHYINDDHREEGNTTITTTTNINNNNNNNNINNNNNNNINGGWSFLQSLPTAKSEKEKTTYVHPLVKRSSSALSQKSLELCTENLGNETGSCDVIESGILSGAWSSEMKKEEKKTTTEEKKTTTRGKRSFPPPLTTMSGRDSLQVRPHREDGRLVIRAVKGPSGLRSCFHAERSDGRLRLRLLEEDYCAPPATFDSEEKIVASEKEGRENDTKEENDVKEEEEDDVEEREKGKMGIREKYERGASNMRRCKEGGEVQYEKTTTSMLLNWEPLWVATS